VHFVHVINNSL